MYDNVGVVKGTVLLLRGGAGSRAPLLAFILTLDAALSRRIIESGTKRNVLYSASFHRCRFLLLSRPRLLASRNSSFSVV